MSKSIAVFGAGPGLGRAVARRYAREGYDLVLVARRHETLEQLAEGLADTRASVHVLAADLSDPAETPRLVDQIRDRVGDLGVIYYAPTPATDFVPAADLTVQQAYDSMPLTFYTLIDLVHQFLPGMLDRGAGAILTAQGASSLRGTPNLSGPGPAQAAQRNYLQSLHAELAPRGIYVGALYVGAIIENSAFHAWTMATNGGTRDWGTTVAPAHLADLLWDMQAAGGVGEAAYPADILGS